jgi:hypothetical protein
LLKDTDFIDEKAYENILSDADGLAKILFTIIKKTRIQNSKQK